MKDLLRQLVSDATDPVRQRNVVREYLQARALQFLQEAGAFRNWAFLGGTALRFLFAIPRYSEDLDFSVTDATQEARFADHLNRLRAAFQAEAYTLDVRVNTGKAVCSAFVRFRGLLFELELSPRRDETLSIKIEVDTNPPAGARTATTIVRRHVTLHLLHHDKASLLAGKLHALLTRRYTKGRDLYDLIWYLSDPGWPEPNLDLLNAALLQTGSAVGPVSAADWRPRLAARLQQLDWQRAAADVRPFLERAEEAALVTRDNCLHLLRAEKQGRRR